MVEHSEQYGCSEAKLIFGGIEMTTTTQKERLNQMDDALFERLDRVRSLIASGEYDHAKLVCRAIGFDLDQVNDYANKLADTLK